MPKTNGGRTGLRSQRATTNAARIAVQKSAARCAGMAGTACQERSGGARGRAAAALEARKAGRDQSRKAPFGEAQPVSEHASAQLTADATHEEPPRGARRHESAVRLTLHIVVPLSRVRQQVTAPVLPQVECT